MLRAGGGRGGGSVEEVLGKQGSLPGSCQNLGCLLMIVDDLNTAPLAALVTSSHQLGRGGLEECGEIGIRAGKPVVLAGAGGLDMEGVHKWLLSSMQRPLQPLSRPRFGPG